MNETEVLQFSNDALAILDRLPFDPEARASYDMMSGGLVWPDELPLQWSPEWRAIKPGSIFRILIGYRASITDGAERAEFRFIWQQVLDHAPNWPGLRPDRHGDRARHRLLAAKRREGVCLRALEDEMDATDNQPRDL